MSVNNEGIIVILSSPSGAGKTTLVKEISKKKNFKISISHTTRKPRSNEINGKDYFFVSENEFKNLIYKDKFLEYAKVFNHYYGSSKDAVLEKIRNGENVIFDIDWQGTQQIKSQKLNYKILTIFILPPSREELYKRLLNRDKNHKEIAIDRMKQFDQDVLHWKDYDLVVINDDLNKCYENIMKFIESADNKKDARQQNLISMHVEKLLI
tara:strand:- start:371 stop:1000 length:630 start_codon:yes stop_codon:yes gene_type:complete